MDYLYSILILIGLFIILASSFDLVIGHCGLISIAHPIFYAIGAYVSAMLAKNNIMPIPLAMLSGGVVACVASALVAIPSLRVSGDYLLIASIGFQLGLIELAFSMLGRNAIWVKVAIFGIGSGIAGIAGGLYAHYFRFIEPDQFGLLQSSAVLTMVVVGGMRTTWGPVIGALVLQLLPQLITFFNLPPSILGPLQGLIFTGLVLVFMFWRPQGLLAAPVIWTGSGSEKRSA